MHARRLLLIDSDRGFHELLTTRLTPHRIEVIEPSDPSNPLGHVKDLTPALLIIAVELPDKVGYALCNKAKKGMAKDIPVILTTSSVPSSGFKSHRKLRVHADEYIDKRTMTEDEVLSKIDRLVGLGGYVAAATPEADNDVDVEDFDVEELDMADLVDESSLGASPMRATGIDGDELSGVPTAPGTVGDARTDVGFEEEEFDPRELGAQYDNDDSPFALEEEDDRSDVVVSTRPFGPADSRFEQVELGMDADANEFEGGRTAVASPFSGLPDLGAVGLAAPLVDPTPLPAPLPMPPTGRSDRLSAREADDADLYDDEEDEAPLGRRPSGTHPRASTELSPRPLVDPVSAPIRQVAEPVALASAEDEVAIDGDDFGLDSVANLAAEEQSGAYDGKHRARILDLERQLEEMRRELEGARQKPAAGQSPFSRERDFLNLREVINKKEKQLLDLNDQIGGKERQILTEKERVRELERLRSDIEARNLELEQKLLGASEELADLRDQANRQHAETARHAHELNSTRTDRDRAAAELEHERADRRQERSELTRGHALAIDEQAARLEAARSAAEAALRDQQTDDLRSLKEAYEETAADRDAANRTALATLENQRTKELAAAEERRSHEVAELEQRMQMALARVEAAREEELATAESRREQEVAEVERRGAAAVGQMDRRRQDELAELVQRHEGELDELRREQAAELETLIRQHQEARQALDDRHGANIARLEEEKSEALATADKRRLGELADADKLRLGELADADWRRLGELAEGDDRRQKELAAAGEERARSEAELLDRFEAARGALEQEHAEERQTMEERVAGLEGTLAERTGEVGERDKLVAETAEKLLAGEATIASLHKLLAERDEQLGGLRGELAEVELQNTAYQEQVLRAFQRIRSDEATVTKAKKAMAIALTLLDDADQSDVRADDQ